MSPQTYARASLLLSTAGALFSGYLSSVRMRSGVCAFDEPCGLFLGHPACYTGFTLFSTLFAVSLAGFLRREATWPAIANTVVSAAGVVFAGRFAVAELGAHARYTMGLPTCAWGLLFFAALLVMSIERARSQSRSARRTPTAREGAYSDT